MAKVLVTGANGHVGCNLVRDLIREGHEVVPLVRQTSDTRGLDGLGLAYARGDVLDRAAVRSAAEGCDFIVNLAAVYETRGVTPEEILRPAVQGVENVLQVAAELGVQRVVHASSVVAIGYGRSPDEVRDERTWNEENVLPYHQAKTESERRAWDLAERHGVELLCINPGAILGQYDHRITPTTRYVQALLEGDAPTGRGGASYVDVRDVSAAFVAALHRGTPGKRYIVASEAVTMREAGELVESLTGISVRYLPVPRWVVRGLVPMIGLVARARGKLPPVTAEEADAYVDRYGVFDTTAARTELGLTFRPTREIFEHTVRWLVHEKALSPKVHARLQERFPPDPAWTGGPPVARGAAAGDR